MAGDVYRSSLGQNSATLGTASAESFGASVGRALQNAGQTVDRIVEQQKQRQREEEAANAGVATAKMGEELDTFTTEKRATIAANGAGHTDAVLAEFDKRSAAVLGGITNKRVKARMMEEHAQMRRRFHDTEGTFEAATRVNGLALAVDTQGTALANIQATKPDPATLDEGLNQIAATVDQLAVGDDAKTKIRKEQQRKVAVAWGNSMQDKDPTTLIATLDKGLLNPFLEPEDINALRSGAHVEIRRADAAARAARAEGEAKARESISVFMARINAGDQPKDEEFAGMIATAKEFGLDKSTFDLANEQVKLGINRETRDWTPAQFEGAVNALEAKGDKRTTDENIRLNHLKGIRGTRVATFNGDPHGAAAVAGRPAPAIDWEAPSAAAVRERVTWAKSYARATGLSVVPYLNKDELDHARQRVNQSPAGALGVAVQLRSMFGGDAANVARQIDPDNKTLPLMVSLPPRTAEHYKRGLDALGRNPDLFQAADARRIFNEYAAGVPQELRTPLFDAAKAILAGAADANGVSSYKDEPEAFESAYRAAVQRAAGQLGGGDGRTGGFVNWNGRRAWLPPELGQGEFQRRLSRTMGNPAAWLGAAVNTSGGREGVTAPYYQGADGQLHKMSAEEANLLGRYQLESVSPGVYRPIGADGGHVVDKFGRPWQFDVRLMK